VTAVRPAPREPQAGLRELLAPRSIAVVGASADPAKWGYWIARGALAGRGRREVHLVNRRGGSVLGQACRRGLEQLPEAPELMVVVTPPAHVRAVVEQGLDLGTRCFAVITSTVDGPGGESADEERALAALVRSRGGRLLGPNCMGVVDPTAALHLSWGEFPSGHVGLVSQSGNLALEIGRLLSRNGEGFSRFVSLGNQRDIDAADALAALVDHEPTRIIAAYVEDFRDGRRLMRVLADARAAGKPVLLLTVGRSEAAGRAAASHTGALVSPIAVVDAACAEHGILRPQSAGELVDAAHALLAGGRPRGTRVAVVGDSGGQGALAADALSDRGLTLPTLSESTTGALRRLLPAQAGLGNPVDLAGAGEADLNAYAAAADLLLADPQVDTVLLTGYFGDYGTAAPALREQEQVVARRLAEAVQRSGRPLVVHTMARDTPPLQTLRTGGVAVYERIEQAASAVALAARWAALPPPPAAAQPPTGRETAGGKAGETAGGCDGGYRSMRDLLAGYGLAFPAARFVATADEAVDAGRALGFPVALKAMGLAHKTEAGGVVLALADADRLREAFARMHARLAAPGYAVEAMARHPHAIELIIGTRWDVSFGLVAMVGIGGTTAELHADTALGLAPLDQERALRLLASLRHAPLLHGWRGAPPVDLAAAARALVAVARAGEDHPELAELEVNPLLVHPGGAVALDAHGVPAQPNPTDRYLTETA